MSNRQLEEIMDDNSNLQMASVLGLSVDELQQLDYDVDTNESDDGLLYEYVVHFKKSSPTELLRKIDGLTSSNCVHLQPYEFEDDPFDEDLKWDIFSSDQLNNLLSNLQSAEKLLKEMPNSNDQFIFLVMLHAHIVASLEAFLSSIFIHKVTNSDKLIRKIIETDHHFEEQKISLRDIYNKHENIQNIVGDYLKRIIFHKMKVVRRLYKSVLNIELGNISWLLDAISVRHHCTHRAGYDEEGNKVDLTAEYTRDLIEKCSEFGKKINSEVTLVDIKL